MRSGGQRRSPRVKQVNDAEVVNLGDQARTVSGRAGPETGREHGAVQSAPRRRQNTVDGSPTSLGGRQIRDDVCLLEVHSDHGVAGIAQSLRDLEPHA